MSIITRAAVRLVIVAVVIVAYSYYQQRVGESRATATYNTAIDRQKIEAGTVLAGETAKVRTAELALRKFKDEQEIKDAENKLVVSGLAQRLRAAAGPTGRLRDPHAARCGHGGGSAPGADPASAGGRAADPAEAGGLLSADLTGLLLSQAKAADDINVAYASCRADSFAMREVLK